MLACLSLAALAACGGGGGGGVTPPSDPGGPPPPSSTPTPVPTATPIPTPTPSPTAVPVSKSLAINAAPGPQINGKVDWYSAGVTVSWTPNPGSVGQNGDTSAGASANNGFPTIDGTSCTQTQEPAPTTNTYAVHSFVGIYYNGTELALPQAIGMKNPAEPSTFPHPNDNYEVESEECEYNIHTHDYGGTVHIEDQRYPQSTSTTSTLPYAPTLQTLLDIWGVQLTPAGLVAGTTTLSGPVAIYYGTPSATDTGPHGGHLTDSYVQASSASAVPLAFHDTIWIVIGAMPAPNGVTGLPTVEWRISY